ncbi:MAG: hypothetical protein ACKO46_00695, partial [Alphaproteobacteria bacterium]
MAERFDNLKENGEKLRRAIGRIGVEEVNKNPRFKTLRERKKKHDAQVEIRVKEFLEKRAEEELRLKQKEDEKLRLQNAPTKDAPK